VNIKLDPDKNSYEQPPNLTPRFSPLHSLTRPLSSNGYNHLSSIQWRARTPPYHLSRSRRAVRAIRRLYLSLLSSPMVRIFLSVIPQLSPQLTPRSVQASPFLPCTRKHICRFPHCRFMIRRFLGICPRCSASRGCHSMQAVLTP
jgi:hypothetical protein